MKKIGGAEVFTIFIGLMTTWAMIRALKMPFLAGTYPLFVCGMILICCIASLIKSMQGSSSIGSVIDIGSDNSVPSVIRMKKTARGFAWLLALYLFTALIGFKLGALVFMMCYVKIEAGVRWLFLLYLSSITLVTLVAFQKILNVYWPAGLLGNWLSEPLPWLF